MLNKKILENKVIGTHIYLLSPSRTVIGTHYSNIIKDVMVIH